MGSTCRGFTMGLRHQQSRLRRERSSRLRSTSPTKRRPYRPLFETLEDRQMMTGFWVGLNPVNPSAGPPSGTQAVMLLSNGQVMVQAGNDAPTTTWYRLTPNSQGDYVN